MTAPPPARPEPCRNCGATVSGAYCAACGQKAEALRVPAHTLVRNTAVEFVGLDGRVWRTFGLLLGRPGGLTVAYLDGRRQALLSPLRVYLTSTLLFFFLLSVVDPVRRGRDAFEAGTPDSLTVAALLARTDAALGGPARPDSLLADATGADSTVQDSTRADLDAAVAALSDSLRATTGAGDAEDQREALAERRRARVERAILATMPPDSLVRADDIETAAHVVYPDVSVALDRLPFEGGAVRGIVEARTSGERADRVVAFAESAIGHVPTVLFLILPIFALLLKALYVRRSWFYSEHLVFGLHTHAFAFVVFAALSLVVVAMRGASGAAEAAGGWATALLVLAIPVYFVLAQKRVYGQSWPKTIAKALVLGSVYSVVLLAGLIGALALAAAG